MFANDSSVILISAPLRNQHNCKEITMVKILRGCNHKPNDECNATNAEAPYAHEYETYTNDGTDWRDQLGDYKPEHLSYHHQKDFTSQDALDLAISDATRLEKELGVEVSVCEKPC
jgi:hypothetical protein